MRIRRGRAPGGRWAAPTVRPASLAVGLLLAGLLGGCAMSAPQSADGAADIDRTVLERLDTAWRDRGLRSERPITGEPRWVLPNGWGFTVARCMVAAGYEDYGFSTQGGFVDGDEPPRADGEQALAQYDCIKRYPIYSTVYARLEDDELSVLYDYYASYLVPCLQSSGARVSAIPDAAEFRAGGEGYPGSWNPYLAIERPESIGLIEPLFEKCPAYPG